MSRAGPRRLDPQQLRKILPESLNKYKASLRPFVSWLDKHSFAPSTAEEFDDLLVEFKNDTCATKTAFEQLVAAIEFFMPRMRRKLDWAHAVLAGWVTEHVPKHAVPMTRGPAALLAAHFAHSGHCRLGMGLWIQQQRGMRPSEMLKLRACDIMFSNDELETQPHAIIKLGSFVGTKAKREQFVLVHFSEHPIAYNFLRELFDSV